MTWRCTGGNLRVSGGTTDTPLEQSHPYKFSYHTHTHTHSQVINTVKVLYAALKIAISSSPNLFADIRIIRMFCVHILFPSVESTRNPLCFIKGCFDYLWSNNDVKWGNIMFLRPADWGQSNNVVSLAHLNLEIILMPTAVACSAELHPLCNMFHSKW